MKLRSIVAGALALVLSASFAVAQTNPGASPLTPSKGGTNSAFVGFTGPTSSIKTFTLPNASGTLAMLSQIQTWTGQQTFSPASGDGLTVNPPPFSFNKGLKITQSSPNSGTVAGPLNYNTIDITHQVGVTGAQPQTSGLKLTMQIGGASVTGQPMIGMYSNMLNTISGMGAGSDKIGMVGSVFSNQSDSGSGYYGSNNVASVASGGSVNRTVGSELAVDVRTGGASLYRYPVMAANYGDVQGSTFDSAYTAGNIGTVGGAFKCLMCLTNSLGLAPIATTGRLFGSDTAFTVANVFDMPNATVTGSILNFPSVGLSGAGQLTTSDIILYGVGANPAAGRGAMGAAANSGLILAGNGTNFDIMLNNKAGTNVCAVSTGGVTLACNTLTLNTALAVTSGGTGNAGTAWPNFTPSLSCGTATFTVNSASAQTIGKSTEIQIDYTIATIGTCTTQGITFTLPNTAAAGGSLVGQEQLVSSDIVACTVGAASTTATCRKHVNAAFAVNNRVVASGVYRNQ